MLKKVFIQTQFGSPHAWTQQYINNVQHLEKYGWYWKIFTPNKLTSKGNVEIIPMNIDQFNDLTEQKLGHRPNLAIVPTSQIPNLHITDFYIFSGVIFYDFLRDADFWGITNLDIVYGRLDHFLPDSLLEDCDVFTDDVNTINGVFSLWRNNDEINNLFKRMINWELIISQKACNGCLGIGEHRLWASDEIGMTNVMRNVEPSYRFKYPKYYPMLSHDRLEQHVPVPKLEIKDDGSLWELFLDTGGVRWEHERLLVGREIPYFHFSFTKRWPLG